MKPTVKPTFVSRLSAKDWTCSGTDAKDQTYFLSLVRGIRPVATDQTWPYSSTLFSVLRVHPDRTSCKQCHEVGKALANLKDMFEIADLRIVMQKHHLKIGTVLDFLENCGWQYRAVNVTLA